MPVNRRAIADALDSIAALMELRGDNPFRVRAFANGARTVKGLADFDERFAAGTLLEVKGIGKGLLTEIDALAATGNSPLLDELEAAVPAGLREIARVAGLGPKKARTLHDDEGIRSLAELEYACRENRLSSLKGFGEKTQRKIRESLAAMRGREGMLRRDDVRALETLAADALGAAGGRAVACGAYRRGETLARGLDLVVTGKSPEKALGLALEALPVEELPARDDRGTARARLLGGAEARITAVPPGAFGLALVAATGPEGHARALGRLRAERTGGKQEPLSWPDEEALYRDLGLPYLPPEARFEDTDLDALRRDGPPRLLERGEVLGAVHAHTTWSDGSGSVAEMLDAARAAGLRWIGMTDHSPTASYAGGLSPERVVEQQEELDREAAARPDLVVFKGTECDILGDGSLDYGEETLRRFDFLVASVHSLFGKPRDEQTRRVLRAVGNPHTTVLGHPTGRLLLGRKGYDLDIPEVLRACARHGVAVELNAHPARLDLDLEWMPLVRELGVAVSIGPDAHETEGFGDLDHGTAVARRAGLPPEQVLNTRDADGARAFFRERRRKAGKAGKT